MKKALILFLIVSLIVISCTEKDTSPLGPTTTDINTSEDNPVEISFGLSLTAQDSVAVNPNNPGSWIYLRFNDIIDTLNTTGIRISMTTAGAYIPTTLEWDVSGGETDLNVKPGTTLSFNTTYILRITGSEVIDIYGNALDIDGDGKEGEDVDDDLIIPFQTLRADSTAGDAPVLLEDTLAPRILSGLYFLRRGDTVTGTPWTDAKLAVDIIDLGIDKSDSTIIPIGLPSGSLNSNTIKLLERDSGNEVGISISYVGDDSDPDFGRVKITPTSGLLPGTFYKLQLLGSIDDASGNKLNKVNYLASEYFFKSLASDEDSTSVKKDIIPPDIDGWSSSGSSFEVTFTERIDPETISSATIYLSGGGEGFLSVREVLDYTVVKYTRKDGQPVSGYTGVVTADIKDLAGNRKQSISTNPF
jgi:hypothetical protein